ncbi:MAG: FHA domain-containing protein [Myxococcales bacterium]|nr:FHA domain-containing protein [Myxococcales bacterium]
MAAQRRKEDPVQDNRRTRVIIGADPAQCDVVFREPSVSSRHCELSLGPSGLLIMDTGSTNGTFVNGMRLDPHRPVAVAVGATIDLGRSCRWLLGPDHAAMLGPGPAVPPVMRATAYEGASIRFGHDTQQIDFPVAGEGVSGLHCAVSGVAGAYRLIDLGSTNGTWFGGQRLEPGVAVPIREGDSFHLGRVASVTLDRQHLAALNAGAPPAALRHPPSNPPSPPHSLPAPVSPPQPQRRAVDANAPSDSVGRSHEQAVAAPRSSANAVKWIVLSVLGVLFVGSGGFAVVRHLMETGGKAVDRAAAKVRGPQTVADKSIDLQEGSARWSSFTLPNDASVRVRVTADPRPVNVYLMRGADVGEFEEALKEPGEKRFSYVDSPVSAKGVRILTQVDEVQAGQWAVVFHHERTSLVDLETTRVHYTVTVE